MYFNYEEEMALSAKEWINKQDRYKFRHYKQLDILNPIIQTVIQYNNNLNNDYIYQKLRLLYWEKCDDLEEFEELIVSKLNRGCRRLSDIIE